MPAARGFIPDDRRASAHVSDAPLDCFLGWRFWLCRKLEHRCLLTLDEFGQQDGLPIRKLKCVMMHPRLVFVDLPKDRRPGFYCFRPPAKEAPVAKRTKGVIKFPAPFEQLRGTSDAVRQRQGSDWQIPTTSAGRDQGLTVCVPRRSKD
jgi:hypothetical protein